MSSAGAAAIAGSSVESGSRRRRVLSSLYSIVPERSLSNKSNVRSLADLWATMPSFCSASRNSRLLILPDSSSSNSRNVSMIRCKFLASAMLSCPMMPATPELWSGGGSCDGGGSKATSTPAPACRGAFSLASAARHASSSASPVTARTLAVITPSITTSAGVLGLSL